MSASSVELRGAEAFANALAKIDGHRGECFPLSGILSPIGNGADSITSLVEVLIVSRKNFRSLENRNAGENFVPLPRARVCVCVRVCT